MKHIISILAGLLTASIAFFLPSTSFCGQISSAPYTTRSTFNTNVEGWVSHANYTDWSPPPGFSKPDAYPKNGGLCLKITNPGTMSHGWWASPWMYQLAPNSLYRIRFLVKTDQSNKSYVPGFRLVIVSYDFKIGKIQTLGNVLSGNQMPTPSGTWYDLWFKTPLSLSTTTFSLRFDMLSDNNDRGEIILDQVEFSSVNAGPGIPVPGWSFNFRNGGTSNWSNIVRYDSLPAGWNVAQTGAWDGLRLRVPFHTGPTMPYYGQWTSTDRQGGSITNGFLRLSPGRLYRAEFTVTNARDSFVAGAGDVRYFPNFRLFLASSDFGVGDMLSLNSMSSGSNVHLPVIDGSAVSYNVYFSVPAGASNDYSLHFDVATDSEDYGSVRLDSANVYDCGAI
jgi:hypothetical protein